MVHDDFRFLEPRRLSRGGDDLVHVADRVDEAERLGLLGRVDAPVREGAHALLGNLAVLHDEPDEAGVHLVDHRLEDGALLGGELAEGRARVLLVGGLDGEGGDPDLLHQPLRVEGEHDDPDRARDRGGEGDDGVAGEGGVVAAGGAHVHHDRHHRDLLARLEGHDLPIDEIGGGDGAARAVDADDESLDVVVALGLLQLLAHAGHDRHLGGRRGQREAGTLVGEDARDVHEKDLGLALAFHGLLAERADARHQLDVEEG